MRAIIATIILSLAGPAAALGETLRFGSSTGDWWFTDEPQGSNADGSLMLYAMGTNKMPVYFFCKDGRYSLYFQPPLVASKAGREYAYALYTDGGGEIEVGVAASEEGRAERAELKAGGIFRLLSNTTIFRIEFGQRRGFRDWTNRAFFPQGLGIAFQFFLGRCGDQGRKHEPPPPPRG